MTKKSCTAKINYFKAAVGGNRNRRKELWKNLKYLQPGMKKEKSGGRVFEHGWISYEINTLLMLSNL